MHSVTIPADQNRIKSNRADALNPAGQADAFTNSRRADRPISRQVEVFD